MRVFMRNSIIKKFVSAVLTAVLLSAVPFDALAGTPNDGINGGVFSDPDTLTWTTNDGTDITYGRGPRFCDVHPEITDPEYYLKNIVSLTGEKAGVYINIDAENNQDMETEELKKFVNSFDWIHSDELTRASQVHDRISNGYHGNTYEYPDFNHAERFPLLVNKKGQCGDFSDEFMKLARFVGLECETYTPSYLHQACLLRINDQWFATDPTSSLPFLSNSKTFPVDYHTEINRYEEKADEKWDVYIKENPDSWVAKLDGLDKRLAAGEITAEEYHSIWQQMK